MYELFSWEVSISDRGFHFFKLFGMRCRQILCFGCIRVLQLYRRHLRFCSWLINLHKLRRWIVLDKHRSDLVICMCQLSCGGLLGGWCEHVLELHHRFLLGGGSEWLLKLWSRVLSGLIGFHFVHSVRGGVIVFVDGSFRSDWSLCRRHLFFSGRKCLH